MQRWLGNDPVGPRSQAAVVMFISFALVTPTVAGLDPVDGRKLEWTLRSRVELANAGGQYRVVEKDVAWEPARTAIIVCDMWDLHHCLHATRRVGELAPRMDSVLQAARKLGTLIIHAPSSCMDAYKDHPARLRARATPRSKNLPAEIGKWCDRIPAEEKGTYPIDQSDGGEDDEPAEHATWATRLAAMGRNPRAPWKSQTDRIAIVADADVISDDGEEIWSVLESRGIDNVILLGVHTNMCVLGRPFGLRQMAKNGKNVVLMRDMTDTMYNPRQAPFVSHFSGTDLIIEHVEKFVCPTISSEQLLGGKPFRFKDDRRPHVAFVIAEDEYRTERTLPEFATRHLARDFRLSFVFGDDGERNALSGIKALGDADLAVVSVRRRALPKPQMAVIRGFVSAGKPVIGIRTASHSFSLREKEPGPPGCEVWPSFDADVLGGSYHGHHGASAPVAVVIAPGAAGNPILAGLELAGLVGNGSLYKVSPLANSAAPLLVGSIPGQPSEPTAWTNLSFAGGRVFYTSLGHPDDFRQPEFNLLLRNAVYWATGRDIPSSAAASLPQGRDGVAAAGRDARSN